MNWHNVLLRPRNLYEELLRRKLISGGGLPVYEATSTTGVFYTDMTAPLKKLLLSLEPIQSGSGTPSPSNVRPISGRTEVVTIVSDAEDGDTYTADFGRTVYGGTVDLTTGILTVDRQYLTVANFSSWGGDGVNAGGLHWVNVPKSYPAAVADDGNICSHAENLGANAWLSSIPAYSTAGSFPARIYVASASYADFQTEYADLQAVYKLAEPQTYQLTPQTIEMIAGRSMFKSNANGNIDISYYSNGTLKTVSGNPVVITDADGQNAEDVTVHFEPIQSGSGTPSPTNIRPISGHTECDVYVYKGAYATPLGRTVYGGTLDVVSGVLTVDRKFEPLNNLTSTAGLAVSWAFDSGNNAFQTSREIVPKGTAGAETGILSSCYDSRAYGYNGSYATETSVIWAHPSGTLRVRDTRFTDVNSWLADVGAQTICYPLATPQTYQLTPQQIRTLLGNNVVTAEGADVTEVVYLTHLVSLGNPMSEPEAQPEQTEAEEQTDSEEQQTESI